MFSFKVMDEPTGAVLGLHASSNLAAQWYSTFLYNITCLVSCQCRPTSKGGILPIVKYGTALGPSKVYGQHLSNTLPIYIALRLIY